MKRKYETIDEAMSTKKGQRMYATLSEQFEQGLSSAPHVGKAMNSKPTYFGSQRYLEHMVWKLMNEDRPV